MSSVDTTQQSWQERISAAALRRQDLYAKLSHEGTDCLHVWHGIAEGAPGLTMDLYGALLLLQSSRHPLSAADLAECEAAAAACWRYTSFAYVDRSQKQANALPVASGDFDAREFNLRYLIRAHHRGRDPWLFLDLRAGRRWLRTHAPGRSVLNLFAYTCSAGLTASAVGAAEVWNVDFSATHLDLGRRNAMRNNLDLAGMCFVKEDCLAVLRQLVGLPVSRHQHRHRYQTVKRRQFGVVVLDPPHFAKGPFGAVDVVRDYQSLFKPAWLAVEQGGYLLATNHDARVEATSWVELLRRCAAKAGRPLRNVELLALDDDFPSPEAGPLLKLAVCC